MTVVSINQSRFVCVTYCGWPKDTTVADRIRKDWDKKINTQETSLSLSMCEKYSDES